MAAVQIQLLRRGNELRRGCHRQPLITRFAALCITPRPTVGAVARTVEDTGPYGGCGGKGPSRTPVPTLVGGRRLEDVGAGVLDSPWQWGFGWQQFGGFIAGDS